MTVFSIITVTKDNLDGLRKTAASVTAQDFTDYEWIVIDGASTDGTAALLPTLPCRYISDPDHGIYDAMNKGINLAGGDYLIFMNAGDEFAATDTLRQAAQLIHTHAPCFIYGDALEDGRHKTAKPHTTLKSGLFTHHQAMFYGRQCIGALRYDTSYKIAADYKFTSQFLQGCDAVTYLPAPVCIFATGGVSQRSAAKGRAEQARIRRQLGTATPGENFIIASRQRIAWSLRTYIPALYWYIRGKGERK